MKVYLVVNEVELEDSEVYETSFVFFTNNQAEKCRKDMESRGGMLGPKYYVHTGKLYFIDGLEGWIRKTKRRLKNFINK